MKRRGWGPMVTLAMCGCLPYAFWFMVALIETATRTDTTPGNHITAAFRWAVEQNPHLTIVLMVCWIVSWLFPAGVILGHVFHRWGGGTKEE